MAPVAYATRAGRGILLATVVGSGIAFLDGTVVNVALPVIGRALGAGLAQLQWMVDAYLLTLTALLLPGGALGDRLGRRRVFVTGLIGFGGASALCGVAPDAGALVAFRGLQGIAAALLVPGSLAILRASIREEDQGRAVGAWAGLSGVTTALGPLAGGWLAQNISWRAIFFVNVPLVAFAVLAALRFVPESREPARGPPDLAGALLAALGLGGIVLALIEATSRSAGAVAATLAAGLALLATSLTVETRRADPMLPLELFRSRAFSGANAITLAVYFALGGATFLLVLQLERGLGWQPVAAGASLLPTTLLTLVLSPLAGRGCGRIGARPFLVGGPLVVAIALFLLGRVGPGAAWAREVFPAAAALGLGLGLTVAPLTTAVLEAAPPARAGVASAVNNAVARLAGLLAVAALPAAGGISPADLARGDFTMGYQRAMELSAALAAAGALVALFAVPGRPTRTPTPVIQAGAAARGVRGRAPPGRRHPVRRGRGGRQGSPPRG